MIRSNLLIRYGLFGIAIAFLFMLVAHFTISSMIKMNEVERKRMFEGPVGLVESFLNEMPEDNRIEVLRRVRTTQPTERLLSEIALIDRDGKVLFAPEDSKILIEDPDKVIELKGDQKQKLYFRKKSFGPGGQFSSDQVRRKEEVPSGPPRPPGFWRIVLIQTFALVGAVLFTVFIMISALRAKAKTANQIIQDLTHGNLKARFPVSPVDEIGQMMLSFNAMADEIERLIESLRKSESVRRDLLRELAHDLRTPIASMKTLVETSRSPALSVEKRDELLGMADREIDYFAGLVDDLLFLGRVSEPQYKSDLAELNLKELVEFETEGVATRFDDVTFDIIGSESEVVIESDIKLLRRLVRNSLENAFSFASSKVEIELQSNLDEIRIRISDDGKGFSQEALANFGQRKFSRAVAQSQGGRISIGLGSVIMRSIVEACRGQLIARNQIGRTGQIEGAEVLIVLPR